jgi:hypothetical protein
VNRYRLINKSKRPVIAVLFKTPERKGTTFVTLPSGASIEVDQWQITQDIFVQRRIGWIEQVKIT